MSSSGGVDLTRALGGRRGVFDSGVPGALFVITYTIGSYRWPDHALSIALWVALGSTAVLAVVRVVRRESVQQTAVGVFGVVLGAVLAARSGNAANFYLPGLFVQVAYAVAYLTSIVIGWPIVGVVVGPLLGENFAWRDDAVRRAMYVKATWVWVAMFVLKLAVQVPLYLAGATIALGVARILMGLPLFAVVVWVTYRLVRSAPPPRPHLAAPVSPEDQP